MRRGILALFLVLSFALQSFAAEVQGNPADKTQGKTVKLDDVVVTATKTEMKTSEAPASIDVLTSEDLAIKANADNIFDALKTIPGTTTLSTGGGMGWGDIKIRGFMPSILINGRDSRHFATNYGLDPGLVGMEGIERIEVLKGPQSTMHGGRAISGAVNIIMKKGDKDNPFLNIKSGFGSGKSLLGSMTTGGGVGNVSYIISLYGDKKDEFKTPKGKIPYGESDRKNFYTRLDYDFNDSHSLTLDYTYNEARHIGGGKGQWYKKLKAYDHKIWDGEALYQSVNLSYNGDFEDLFSLYLTSGIGENNYDYVYGYNGWGMTDLNDYLSRQNYTEMENKFFQNEIRGTLNLLPDEKLRIVAGVQHKTTKLDWLAIKNHKFSYRNKETETVYAPYGQVEYRPVDQILAIAGVRYDRYTYDESSSKSSTSPRFSLSYFPFANTNYDYTTLWASYTEAFNPPSAVQMLGNAFIDPNPDIKPEKAKGWEVGLKQRLSRWGNFEFSYFDTDYTDMLAVQSKYGMHRRFYNINKANVEGMEAKLEVFPTDWLSFYSSYSTQKREDKGKGKRLFGQPDEVLSYGVSIHDLKGFSADLSALRLGKYKNSSGYRYLGAYHPSNGKTILNFKALYKYSLTDNVVVEPYVTINNLTDEEYYEGATPGLAEGRNYQTGVALRVEF
ncbi:TonB-dependent receptor plug domain-containing protein [Desulfomicrobium orale]|uniref:TonB-dependent receptor n=1 Tax=Desulfomicrobium orale DSM 12838 TaxID=888061 RepID=A0A0X8JS58_9BACT|nr:TonB-dependent receptor [Desulfomicrobium orale]AMD93523.1 hypothetical protein AXF15_10705 [Desulfomicrobium orale DSM 12838]